MRNDRGFTLVEVLVALVVTSILLVIIIDGAVVARRRVRVADERRQAIFLARTLIAGAGVAPFRVGPWTGRVNNLGWRVSQSIVRADQRKTIALVDIRATIFSDAGVRLFTIDTWRLKPLPTE